MTTVTNNAMGTSKDAEQILLLVELSNK